MPIFGYFSLIHPLLCCLSWAVSPTNISQYNLPAGGVGSSGSGMSRSNSIPAQDSFDLYGEGHPLGGSANSLEERPRAISRSGSFRDSMDEGENPVGLECALNRLTLSASQLTLVKAFSLSGLIHHKQTVRSPYCIRLHSLFSTFEGLIEWLEFVGLFVFFKETATLACCISDCNTITQAYQWATVANKQVICLVLCLFI